MSKILNKYTGDVICESDDLPIKELAQNNKANLRNANLEEANFSNANLEEANFYKANLRNANLEEANFYKANLRNANLRNANLEEANFSNANLEEANLRNANLEEANFSNANLRNANFYNANLEEANLRNANLSIYCKWVVSYKIISNSEKVTINELDINLIQIEIGCKSKTIKEWDLWFASQDEYSTNRDTFEFRQIQGMYNAYKSYLTTVYGEVA